MERYLLARTMRVLKPQPFLYAFYDGRENGKRIYSPQPNWLDDAAYGLGIASYALVDDEEALVYDTHISLDHAHKIRNFIEALGVKRIRVVLSHGHLDHIAGNEAFADCEIIAHAETLLQLKAKRPAIETGVLSGPPAISKLILPTTTYHDEMRLRVGRIQVDLRHVNIHSSDGTMLVLGDFATVLAGDALEDSVTFVAEPQGLDVHLRDLERMWNWDVAHFLPCHGDPAIIAAGGYRKGLIKATQQYIRTLKRCTAEPSLRTIGLKEFVAGPLRAGWITYYAPYEAVHRKNIDKVAHLLNT